MQRALSIIYFGWQAQGLSRQIRNQKKWQRSEALSIARKASALSIVSECSDMQLEVRAVFAAIEEKEADHSAWIAKNERDLLFCIEQAKIKIEDRWLAKNDDSVARLKSTGENKQPKTYTVSQMGKLAARDVTKEAIESAAEATISAQALSSNRQVAYL